VYKVINTKLALSLFTLKSGFHCLQEAEKIPDGRHV